MCRAVFSQAALVEIMIVSYMDEGQSQVSEEGRVYIQGRLLLSFQRRLGHAHGGLYAKGKEGTERHDLTCRRSRRKLNAECSKGLP